MATSGNPRNFTYVVLIRPEVATGDKTRPPSEAGVS